MIDGMLTAITFGPALTLLAIAMPVLAAGVGVLLVWSGLEGKRWWPVRLVVGAPLLAFGAFGLVYMTIT